MFIRADIKAQSKAQLRGRWAVTGGLFLLINVLIVVLQYIPLIGSIVALLITAPLMLSMTIISFKVTRGEELRFKDAWVGFYNFGRAIGLYFWIALWVWLWLLLLIIPGIIKGISYSMAFYILADNPDIGVREALNESKRMTQGYKWDLFVLGLSFIGWGILSILTLGIGYFWLESYMQVTYVNAYKKLAGKQI